MKKLLATLLTIAILCTLVTVPVSVSAATTSGSQLKSQIQSNSQYKNTSDQTVNVPVSTETVVTGFGGKAANDESLYSLCGAQTSYSDYKSCINHKQFPSFTGNFGYDVASVGNGYVVMEANVFPETLESIGDFYVQPNAGVDISPTITASENLFNVGQWNNIRVVYQPSTATASPAKYGYTYFYINGKLVKEGQKSNYNANYVMPYRLTFDAKNKYPGFDQKLCWDDISVSVSATNPGPQTMPALSETNKYGISGNKIVTSGELKVSDIAQSGLVISAYDIRHPETLLSSDAVLDANTVVVATSGAYMTSYTLGTNIEHTFINNSNGSGINNASTATTVKGIMGRESNDSSTYYTRVVDSNGANNHKFQYIISTGKADSGYGDLVVFGLSVYAHKNMRNIVLTGNGGVGISKSYPLSSREYFNEGWNKVVFLYDHSTAGDELNEYGGSWALYINGKCVNALGENRMLMAAANPFNYISKGKMDQMRIMLTCANTNELGVYCDDVFAYRIKGGKDATIASFAQAEPTVTAATASEYTVSGTTVVPGANATVASLNVTEGATVKVYANDDYALQLKASDKLEEDNKIIVSKDGMYTYYTVSAGANDNKIYTTRFSGGSYASGLTLANTGFFTTDYVTGKAGKQASDTSLNFKRAKTDGQAESWNGNNIYTYVTAPIDKAYIKYEMNFMPGNENFRLCKFATQGHANIGPELYCNDEGSSANHVLNRYQWNKLVYVFKANSTTVDPAATKIPGKYDLYVNGVKIVDNAAVNISKNGNNAAATVMPIRFAIFAHDEVLADKTVNYSELSCFMDDIDIRWYDEEPTVKPMPYAIDDNGQTVLIEGNKYTIYDDLKVKDIEYSEGANLTVFDVPTYDYYLIDTNALYNNNLIVVWDNYNQYTYYTVAKELRNVATITPYAGYYVAKANLKDAVLFIAGYDEYGNLKAARYANNAGNAEVRIDGDYDIVKAFIWNSLTDLTPLAEEKTYIAKPIVACWGASITYGQGATNADTDTYPAHLATLTGFDVYNMGIGGETQTTIAARQGGLDMRLTEDITIPESGSVSFMFRAYDKDGTYAGVVSPRNASLAGWNPATINGVEGTLKVDIDNTIWPRTIKSATFTRKTAGAPVEAKAGDIMTVAANDINAVADITVICVSSNGGWNNENLTANDSQAEDLIKLVDKMIANTKDPDKFLVIGLTTQDGSAWRNTHTALANYYGDKFLNIKNYITSEQALIDSGITPTATDKEWIAAGHVPPSLINNPAPTMAGGTGYDNVHLNTAGYKAMARDIYKRFIELGYCAAN